MKTDWNVSEDYKNDYAYKRIEGNNLYCLDPELLKLVTLSGNSEDVSSLKLEISLNLCIDREECETPEYIEEWLAKG